VFIINPISQGKREREREREREKEMCMEYSIILQRCSLKKEIFFAIFVVISNFGMGEKKIVI